MVHAIQPTAAEHGRIAALNMAGRDATYKGSLIMNVLDTAGLISILMSRADLRTNCFTARLSSGT